MKAWLQSAGRGTLSNHWPDEWFCTFPSVVLLLEQP